jgi:hypothetical protein
MQAKNALGEAFGTKKIKQQIKSVERNAVNVSTLHGIAPLLHDSIAAKTSTLPSKGIRSLFYFLEPVNIFTLAKLTQSHFRLNR